MVEYYLAEKGCSRVLHECLILVVDGNEIRFHKGNTPDKFGVGKNGRPEYLPKEMGLEYELIGPLSESQLKFLDSLPINTWSDLPGRVHSLR